MPVSIPSSTLEKFTTFGDLLRFLRRRVGMTQMELATAVGYSDTQISRLEQNERLPDIPTVEASFIPALGLEDEPKAITRLLELAANVRREDAPALGLCPYKGLNYFDEADADLFVGREALAAKLTERVLSLTLSGAPHEPRFLAVVGASGSGKSSLVRAGLVSALRWNKSSTDWRIHILTPTAHPLQSLAATLNAEKGSAAAALAEALRREENNLQIFVKRQMGSKKGAHLLLVIDQFEELFALCHFDEERASFIGNLLTAASDPDGPLTVVITLRADFYAHCANYPLLRDALAQSQEYIGAMNEEELRRAIEEPARRGRWEFEPGLVDLLLRDVGHEPGALPLLSHALLETWQRRRGRTMTLSGYTSSGGVRGAIAETAETVFTDQFTQEQQAIARRIFLRLTELGDEMVTAETRRRATFNELILKPEEAATTHAVLKALADARLITTSEDSAEVAHEALIREWPTLRGWLEDNREELRLQRNLTDAAQEWSELNREPDSLYRGARLAQAREWAASHADEMNTLENEFLNASMEYSEREAAEREAQRQRELEAAQKLAAIERTRAEEQAHSANRLQMRNRLITAVGAVAILLAVIAGVFTNKAQTQQRIATSRELAAAAISNLEVDPERSILLALEALSVTYSVDKSWTIEAEDALHRALLSSRVELSLHGHTDPVWAIAFSPDGARLATASDDGTAIIWDATTGQTLLSLTTHATRGRHGLAFSPDGTRLITASDNRTATVWNSDTGEEVLTLDGHTDGVSSVAFSPDGSRIATASEDRTAKIWDAVTGEEVHTLSGHTHAVWSVAFSPDGRHLATTSEDSTAKVWDVATGAAHLTLRDHTGPVNGFAFSPDGLRVATSSDDNTAKIWDVTTGEALFTLRGHSDTVARVAFSPDGVRLATTSFDRKVKVWDTATGQELFTLAGHTDAVIGVEFSPDCVNTLHALRIRCGTRLATASWDGTARVWNTALNREQFAFSVPNAHSTALSPDCTDPLQETKRCRTRFAAGFADGSVKLWDISSVLSPRATIIKEPLNWQTHTGPVNWLAFSPDGARLATAGEDQIVKIWDVNSGEELFTLHGHAGGISFVVFSLDGTRLATTSKDHTVRVWDILTAEPVFILSNSLESSWVTFSPDGTRLAASHVNGTAKIWDAETGVELLTFRGHSAEVWAVTFSLDGKRLATASQDGTAKVWDAATGELLFTLSGHAGPVNNVAFNLDGTRLVTAGEDGITKVWDTSTSQPLLTLAGHQKPIRNLAFNQSGTRLFTASVDGTLLVYVFPIEDLTALARARLTRSLTIEECQQYLHVEQCSVSSAPFTETPSVITMTMTVAAPQADKNKVCQLTDVTGVSDQFYNHMAYEGIQEAVKRFHWEGTLLESQSQSDYERNVHELLGSNCDLIVIPSGPFFEDIVKSANHANPSQKFIIMEVTYHPPLENVRAQFYATDQAAFLAGYAAASATRTGMVATYGGAKFPAVIDFMNGFALGVAYYNEKNNTQVEVLGWDVAQQDGLFTGNFDRTDDGRKIGENLLNEGADIILPVAGRVGLGTAAVIQERGDAYLIGVDSDWAMTYPDYADIILTSIQKRVDTSVLSTIQAIEEGTFIGGTHIGTLETGEVTLAPFHNLESLISAEVKADLEQIRKDIIVGKIKTKP